MSDERREAVAKAIAAVIGHDFDDTDATDQEAALEVADAAIAAYEAHQPEPTEAEVEVSEMDFARDEVFEVVSRWRRTQNVSEEKWQEAFDEYHAYVDRLALRLIAARKAGR